MVINGITSAGDGTERLFCELTGAKRTRHGAPGDAILDGRPIEIKRAGSMSLNQVRAVRYMPVVAFYVPQQTWYVIPASRIVALAAHKGRGQHSANPFESTVVNLHDARTYHVIAANLRQAVLDAFEEGDRHPQLRQLMDDIALETWQLTARSVRLVREALGQLTFEAQL